MSRPLALSLFRCPPFFPSLCCLLRRAGDGALMTASSSRRDDEEAPRQRSRAAGDDDLAVRSVSPSHPPHESRGEAKDCVPMLLSPSVACSPFFSSSP